MDWGLLSTVFVGLAIFIYGMHLMTTSLKSLSLSRIKEFFNKATSNRIKSFLIGIGVTSLIQSSSATSVIVIGVLNVGMLSLAGAVPIIFGANIGTTITAQLIAFKLTKIAPVFVIAGLIIFFLSKKIKKQNIGLLIFGFGLIFFGLGLMTSAVKPFSQDEQVLNLFIRFGNYPLLCILVGLIVTVMFQSSSATIGMVIALGLGGLINFPTAFYLILGDNIGTCITAVLASLTGSHSAKRLALAHALFNVIGTVITLILAPLYLKLIPLTSGDIARQIANSHTIFNIINALLFLPFVPLYVKLLKKIIPGKDYTTKSTKYLDPNLIKTPTIAFGSVMKELVVMTQLCKDMMIKSHNCFKKFDYKLHEEIKVDEDTVDETQKKITAYLVEITKQQLAIVYSRRIPKLIHSVNDLEKVGDYCESLADLARRKNEDKHVFSKTAERELDNMFRTVFDMFELTIEALNGREDSAQKALEAEDKINKLSDEYTQNHVQRMKDGKCQTNAGLIYNDVLSHIEKTGDHLTNVNEAVLHNGEVPG